MDCITFGKQIKNYLAGQLDDETLNEFLLHFRTCRSCAEDLEINYIAEEGLKILDDERVKLDLSEAFRNDTQLNLRKLKIRNRLLRAAFVADTLLIWVVLASIVVYMRII